MAVLKFANDMALKLMHELRNPLVSIGGFSKRISSRDYQDDKLKEYTTIIFEQAKRLDGALSKVLVQLQAAADES
jgi:nitrogen-specific signal transduction histidine kinase